MRSSSLTLHWHIDGIECAESDVRDALPLSVVVEVTKSMMYTPKYEEQCPSCATRLSAFEEELLVGCPLCYVVFQKQILKAIQK